jgi:hypothetical protein
MTMVKKFTAATTGSAFVTALAFGAAGAVPADLLLQPYFWVATFSLTGLWGLATGNGIGGSQLHQSSTGTAQATGRTAAVGVPA